MSSSQKLSNHIEALTHALETIKQKDQSLDQMMDEFGRAIEAYNGFESAVKAGALDVKKIETRDDGTYIETLFDWQKNQGSS